MCNKFTPPNLDGSHQLIVPAEGNFFRQGMRRAALPVLSIMAALCVGLLSPRVAAAASFQEQGGKVIMEAENFDLNSTVPAGSWLFDANPLTNAVDGGLGDPYSGWGYLKPVGVGGTSSSLSPHVDYKVNFTTTGPHYIWVLASDAGGASIHLGLDGVVPSTAYTFGNDFGYPLAGELWWDDQYNPSGGYTHHAYLDVPSTGEHTVNLFFRQQNTYVDKILLTTDINYEPSPLHNGDVGPQTLAPAANLAVALTQPAPGKSFPSNTVVVVAAKPFTNSTSVSKVDFFASLLPSGTETNIGEATALPYQIGWTNPAVGNYTLKAVVTDSLSATATSAVVNVAITVPNTCPTPLIWETNTFDLGLGSFTLEQSNHVVNPLNPSLGIDFDWSNSTNAGGPAGELGGTMSRIGNAEAYVAEPLSRLVSLNDELWFRSSLRFGNGVTWNTDFFFGYFDTNSTASRVGFKIRNPDPWRFSLFAISEGTNKVKFTSDNQFGQFEFHWIPSGLGDGTGVALATAVTNGVTFMITNAFSVSSAATFNAFGWLLPYQPTSDSLQTASAYFDNIEHKVPGYTTLNWQRVGNQLVLSWGADGYTLQYNDISITNPNGWLDSDPVTPVGRTYSVTNTITPGTRFYRLKLNCL